MMAFKNQNQFLVFSGTFIFALGIKIFFESQSLLTGGITGVSILIGELSGILLPFRLPLWLSYGFLEILNYAFAYKTMGLEFIKKTAFCSVFISMWLFVLDFLPALKTDLFLAAVFGGVLLGLGLGMVLRGGSNTGGTNIWAAMVHKKAEHISISSLLFVFDGLVILSGLFLYGAEKTMYSIVAIFISSKVINTVLVGTSYCRAVFIISEKAEAVSEALLFDLDRGVTGLQGKGMYTRKDKQVLFCVIAQKEITAFRQIVRRVDPQAFVMVTDAREVLGEGFEKIF